MYANKIENTTSKVVIGLESLFKCYKVELKHRYILEYITINSGSPKVTKNIAILSTKTF